MKKLLVSLMLIIYSVVGAQNVTSLDPSQVYNTGSIVNNSTAPTTTTGTWQNIGLWNQGLPCWGPGGPVYCGPQPYFNNGSFNFSYGTTDVYQTANVANSLPGSGSGLRVNGYNFSFMAKNGNGWDDGRQDYLIAYTVFRDAAGAEKFSKTYDLNQNIGSWFNYSFSETFTTPFATKDLGTVQYGFVGRDNNFWAGPYGPEVTNISFSLKYSVDPCYVNVLSSPTCPGYLDALNKLITPTTTSTSTPITTTSTSATTTTTITVEPTSVTTTSTTTVGQPTVVAPIVSAPASTTTSSSTSTVSTTSTQSNKETTTNNSLALSVISKNSERDNAALSVAQTAVSQAAQAAQQAQQEAASIASSAVTNSQSANIVSINGQQSSGTGIKVNNTSNSSTSILSNQNVTPGAVVVSMLSPQMQSSAFTTPVTTATGIEQQQTPQITILPNNNAMTTTPQNYAIVPPNFLTDRTNPLTEVVEGRQFVPSSNNVTTTGPSVNKNTSDNEAAGGVNIDRMALAPTGYGDYLNFALRDAAFYAPKEVYKNQKNVDNARVLRQLTNDNKHKEMVELQYTK